MALEEYGLIFESAYFQSNYESSFLPASIHSTKAVECSAKIDFYQLLKHCVVFEHACIFIEQVKEH